MNSHNTQDSKPSEVPESPTSKKSIAVKKAANTSLKWPKTIEIAGYTILAMPLESMKLTPEQEKKFIEEGWLMNPSWRTAVSNKEKMMQWDVSFEKQVSIIAGIAYTGFNLWKKVYEWFPEYRDMTKEQAIKAGLYPMIYYRNHFARKWLAEMHGGHIATHGQDGSELVVICKELSWSSSYEERFGNILHNLHHLLYK